MIKRKYSTIFTATVLLLPIISILMPERKYALADNINKKIYSNMETVSYTVQKGDCIELIAQKYKKPDEKLSNVVTRIQVTNNVNEFVKEGQKLEIPIK